MKKVKHDTEAQFAIELAIGASKLGALLVHLGDSADITKLQLIKEVSADKNIPKGAFRKSVIEIMTKAGGSMNYQELMKKLRAAGFRQQSVYAGLRTMKKNLDTVRKGEIIRLGKAAAE